MPGVRQQYGKRQSGSLCEPLEERICFSPFAMIRMEVNGGLSDGATSLSDVTVGQVINYRLVAQLARPLPVHNDSAAGDADNNASAADMTSIDAGSDGVGTARFNIYQLASDGIQVDFASAATLVGGGGSSSWTGTGSTGGTPVARSNGLHDLASVRAVGPNGTYAGRGANGEITIATGSFTVASMTGNAGQVRMTYLDSATVFADSGFPSQAPGTLRYNGGSATPVASASDADPLYGFVGLTLNSTADVTAPHVTAVSPADNASATSALTQFLLTFSEPVQGLSTANVSVTGPNGAVPFTIGQQGQTTFAIDFGPFANLGPGDYTLTVSPTGVTDLAGNPLDQNGNGTGGETTDAFTSHYTILAPPPPAGADLTATVTGATTLLPGNKKNVASVRIADAGTKPAKGKVPIAVYLIADGATAPTGKPIATGNASVKLNAGAARTFNLRFKSPTGFADGSYHYLVTINANHKAAEVDFSNDTSTGNAVTYQAPFVDLRVVNVTAPASANSAKKTPVAVTITNAGNFVAKGKALLSLLHAADPAATDTPTVLSSRVGLNLAPGKTKVFKLTIKPHALPAGTDDFLAARVDWTAAPAERNASDNLKFSDRAVLFS